jgi:Flp pilus assembly protein TadD
VALSALTVGSYWLAHASIDWFWNYPALTAPVMALLGAACAPAAVRPVPLRASRRGRLTAAVAVGAAALSMLPPYLSVLWTDRAYAVWRADPDAAYASLRRAQVANPLSQEPLLAEGAIATRADDPARAVRAFRRAGELQPDDWAPRYLLGKVLLERHPRAALRSLRDALALNPASIAARRAVAIALRESPSS